MKCLNVQTIFFNGGLEEYVYMDQHEGFVIEPIVNKRCANFNVLYMVLNKPHNVVQLCQHLPFQLRIKQKQRGLQLIISHEGWEVCHSTILC
jgi:hypothetical protein